MNVLTLGTFDLFHRGHVRLLARAAQHGPVTVALNTDRFIQTYKGRPPVLTYRERLEVLQACRHVERVVPNSEDGNSRGVIRACKPDLIVIGDDWLERDYLAQLQIDREFLAEHSIGILFVPYTGSISTTELRYRCLGSGSPSSAPSTDATKTLIRCWPDFTPRPVGDLMKHGWSAKPAPTPNTSAPPQHFTNTPD